MTKEQEFLLLLNQQKNILYKISRMYMDTAEDREDLIQEITFQLWKAYDSFEGKSMFSTWMYRVALNTALTFFKKGKKKVDNIPISEGMDKVDEDFSVRQREEEQLAYFYDAVQDLNKTEKALIFLFLEGQTHKDIAANLGITAVNARVKLNRTKEKLQQIIRNRGYEF